MLLLSFSASSFTLSNNSGFSLIEVAWISFFIFIWSPFLFYHTLLLLLFQIILVFIDYI